MEFVADALFDRRRLLASILQAGEGKEGGEMGADVGAGAGAAPAVHAAHAEQPPTLRSLPPDRPKPVADPLGRNKSSTCLGFGHQDVNNLTFLDH
jgi:hypothetical protein